MAPAKNNQYGVSMAANQSERNGMKAALAMAGNINRRGVMASIMKIVSVMAGNGVINESEMAIEAKWRNGVSAENHRMAIMKIWRQ
jgi:hypothetical protein